MSASAKWPQGFHCGVCRDRNEKTGMTCAGPDCRHHPDHKECAADYAGPEMSAADFDDLA